MSIKEELGKSLVPLGKYSLTKRSEGLARRGLKSLQTTVWMSERMFEDGVWGSGIISQFGKVASGYSGNDDVDTDHALVINLGITFTDFANPSNKISIDYPAAFPYVRTDEGLSIISEKEAQELLTGKIFPQIGKLFSIAAGTASYAWSPCGNYLLTGSNNPECALRFFDSREQRYVECFGRHGDSLFNLDWSPSGEYLASASFCYDPHLKLWRCSSTNDLFASRLEDVSFVNEVELLKGYPRHHWNEDKLHQGFYGFKELAFSPDSARLAIVGDICGERDILLIYDVPGLREINRIEVPVDGEVMTISWFKDGNSILFTCESSVFKVALDFQIYSWADLSVEATQPFSDETYQKMKPLFKLSLAHFKDAATNLREAMKELIGFIKSQGYPAGQLANFKQYVIRFFEDVQARVIKLNDTVADNHHFQEGKHNEATSSQNGKKAIAITGLDFDICACNPKFSVVAFAVGRYKKERENEPVALEYIGGLISIRKLSDFSIVSEFTGPAGVTDLRWSADGTKVWAICKDGTMLQGELPIAFRQQ